MRSLVLGCTLLALLPSNPAGAESSTSTTAARRIGSGGQRLLSTADRDVRPEFRIWKDEDLKSFIKPVIEMSSSVVGYLPQSDAETSEFAHRVSTLLLARIGFEGELFDFITFRTVFERNLGFALLRNGPVGTSVWEGTASWQARDNYIRLQQWGFSLAAGIVPDPATVDYISNNILDSFAMDPYVRDPLLISGFNRSQAVLLRYSPKELAERWDWLPRAVGGLTAGLSFTGGNPLVSSLSFGFGGEVNQLGTLFSAPLRALANGIPGSNIHLLLLSPSLSYEWEFGPAFAFGIKTAAQFYWVDNDVTQGPDPDDPDEEFDVELRGENFRVTAELAFLDRFLRVFGTAAYRNNDRVDLPIPGTDQLSPRRFRGSLVAGGLDFDLDKIGLPRLGFGGNYYYIFQYLSDPEPTDAIPNPPTEGFDPREFTFHYINVGVTYWLWSDVLSTGFRWARLMSETEGNIPDPVLHTVDNFILSLRLTI